MPVVSLQILNLTTARENFRQPEAKRKCRDVWCQFAIGRRIEKKMIANRQRTFIYFYSNLKKDKKTPTAIAISEQKAQTDTHGGALINHLYKNLFSCLKFARDKD